MNVSLMNISTDTYKKGSVFAGGLPMLQNMGSKSAQEKAERQQKAQNEVSFWEKQKENLKATECETPEEIAKKLEALHSYEDEIAAAKKSFNQEQMWHVMDEARELGEKIAEAAKKMEPKTAEERREEAAEEAAGTKEDSTAMEEVLDEATEVLEELTEAEEEILEEQENTEELEELAEKTQEMKEEKEALKVRQEEAKEEEEQQEALQEERLAAREARSLEAYRAAGKKYRYQTMDIVV